VPLDWPDARDQNAPHATIPPPAPPPLAGPVGHTPRHRAGGRPDRPGGRRSSGDRRACQGDRGRVPSPRAHQRGHGGKRERPHEEKPGQRQRHHHLARRLRAHQPPCRRTRHPFPLHPLDPRADRRHPGVHRRPRRPGGDQARSVNPTLPGPAAAGGRVWLFLETPGRGSGARHGQSRRVVAIGHPRDRGQPRDDRAAPPVVPDPRRREGRGVGALDRARRGHLPRQQRRTLGQPARPDRGGE